MHNTASSSSNRRAFLGKIAVGSAAVAASGIATTLLANSAQAAVPGASDEWLNKIKGAHKQFFDGVTVNDGFALGFADNFLNAHNSVSNVPDSALTAVVGLRHFAIPIAFTDAIWAKYKLGEFLKLMDPATGKPLTRNMYFHAHDGELPLPGMSLDKLQARGVIVTVCGVALNLLATLTSKTAGVSPEEAKKEWVAGMIPGTNLVPAGVWAVNRAQEKGCTYCSAG